MENSDVYFNREAIGVLKSEQTHIHIYVYKKFTRIQRWAIKFFFGLEYEPIS